MSAIDAALPVVNVEESVSIFTAVDSDFTRVKKSQWVNNLFNNNNSDNNINTNNNITVKPGQAFCPRIKIWSCCSKFESVLRSNFSN